MINQEFAEINSVELRKFTDVWGPLVLSMPRVISVVERVEELERHVVVLEQRRDEASTEAVRLKDQGEQDLAAARLALIDINRERQAATRAVSDHKKQCELRIKKAAAEAEETDKRLKSELANAKIEQASELQALRLQLEAARANQAEEIRKLEIEAQDLVGKKEAAQVALDELKSRLG
jgi:hypothetical protein